MTVDQRRDRHADLGTERARAGGEAFPRTPAPPGFATCRACCCWEYDACVDAEGHPCHWIEPDLCSACRNAGQAAAR